MQRLSRGQKIKLADLTSSQQLRVGLAASGAGLTFDSSCFGVDAVGQLSDDRYLVFFNQLSTPENAVRLTGPRDGDNETFEVDLARLPAKIQRLVFVITIDGNGTMSQLSRGHVRLLANGSEAARFEFSGNDFATEKAIMALEIYRKDVWRVAAVGQGFAGGLSAVLKHFGGVEIEEDNATPNAPLNAASSQPPPALPNNARPAVGRPSPPPPVPGPQPPAAPGSGAGGHPSPGTSGRVCVRCGKNVGFFASLLSFNSATGRCADCEREVRAALERFRTDFINSTNRGTLLSGEWEQMWARFNPTLQKVDHTYVLQYIRSDALQYMERLLDMAAADAIITEEEERYIKESARVLDIPAASATSLFRRMEHFKSVAWVREGHLSVVQDSGHHLEAGEICHLSTEATYCKVNTRSTTHLNGRLIATNKKLHFLSPTGGWTIQYKNVMRVLAESNAIQMELSTKSGNGRYLVGDPLMTEATLTTLTKIAKRQMLSSQGSGASRHIPQDVKIAVWQRDGGKCVECGDNSYLEYDHDIPFSRGGASTVGNVRLLCRRCNLAKGDRI